MGTIYDRHLISYELSFVVCVKECGAGSYAGSNTGTIYSFVIRYEILSWA